MSTGQSRQSSGKRSIFALRAKKRNVKDILLDLAKKNKLFVYIVLVPLAVCILYFGFIESDIYVSECVFVVRQPEKKGNSGVGSLLQSFGVSSVREEAFTVRSYILSRDALKVINENIDLRKAFGKNKIDLLNRFDPIGIDDSFEALYKYFLKRVSVDIDMTSSIATLRAKAFSSQDAFNINEGLLFMSEGLINKLNDRARKDMLDNAVRDVDESEREAKETALALSIYQDKEILFDPAQQSTMQLQQVSRLQTELLNVRGLIAHYREFASESPQKRGLEKRAAELRKEIDLEMSKVAGGDASMTQKLIEYERLKLDRMFSEKKLAAALTSLEQAKSDVQRQQLYLERIVHPNLPDNSIYPNRMTNILAAAGLLLVLYGVVELLVIGVIEHQD
jgi:capsular polysaccharide transport system permease protein